MSRPIDRLTAPVMHAARALLLAALAVTLAAPVAGAQGASPESILKRYTKAVDPEGKLATLEGFSSTMTVEMPAQGMSMTMKNVQRRPNHLVSTMTMTGVGELRQGFDGTTAWAVDPMQGPRILSEAEAQQLRDGADFKVMARDPSTYEKAEAAGEAQVDGELADCIKITWKSTRVTTECFARSSGLLVETRTTSQTPQGEVAAVTRMYDYKPVGGILMAHRMVNQMMGMTQNITLSEATTGKMPAEAFELPPEIKALKKP